MSKAHHAMPDTVCRATFCTQIIYFVSLCMEEMSTRFTRVTRKVNKINSAKKHKNTQKPQNIRKHTKAQKKPHKTQTKTQKNIYSELPNPFLLPIRRARPVMSPVTGPVIFSGEADCTLATGWTSVDPVDGEWRHNLGFCLGFSVFLCFHLGC